MPAWLPVTQPLPRISPTSQSTSYGKIRLIQAALLASTFLSSIAIGQSNGSDQCPVGKVAGSLRASVSTVLDGDSVVLDGGEQVRIIGINAPEIYPEDQREQRFAKNARERVAALLRQDDGTRAVTLVPGREPTDQHGRSLYHLLLPSGQNIALTLLHEGLAVQSAVSPNTRCAVAYAAAESAARLSGRGLWSEPDFWLFDRRKIPRSSSGFYIVRDRVKKQRVVNTKQGTAQVLNLANGANVYVSADNHAAFVRAFPGKLTGKKLEVRGWFYRYKRKSTVNLHHPANLRVLD